MVRNRCAYYTVTSRNKQQYYRKRISVTVTGFLLLSEIIDPSDDFLCFLFSDCDSSHMSIKKISNNKIISKIILIGLCKKVCWLSYSKLSRRWLTWRKWACWYLRTTLIIRDTCAILQMLCITLPADMSIFCLSSSNFLIFSSSSCFILSIRASFSLCNKKANR